MAITQLDRDHPHFRARITVLRAGDGTEVFFGFPRSGIRTAPVEMPDAPSVGPLGIYHQPNARFRSGESFEADCTACWDGDTAPVLSVGFRFRLWGASEPQAEGEIISLYETSLHTGRKA